VLRYTLAIEKKRLHDDDGFDRYAERSRSHVRFLLSGARLPGGDSRAFSIVRAYTLHYNTNINKK